MERDHPASPGAGRAARARRLLQRVAGAVPLGRRELLFVAAAMALGLAIRIAYVVLTKGHVLAGDEVEYDIQGRFIVDGQWFWSTTPFGIPHESLWKPPGYTAFVGVLYKLLGANPDRVFLAQSFIGPVTIGLTWLLGRRLFTPAVGMVAAAIVAVYPFAWQFEVRLYSESLAVPLTLVVLLVVLGNVPTPKRAALTGALLGVSLLVRPSAMLLVPAILLAWWLTAGARRGIAMTALVVGVAVLVVAPWTYRNHQVEGGFVPISAQDGAGFGVFNDDAANDPDYPYKWRRLPSRDRDLFDPAKPISDTEVRRELQDRMWTYIREHPDSVPKAFFWNGITRLWDIRRPRHALDETNFDGRTRGVVAAGLAMYWVLLPLALAGLWRLRRRRELVLPVLGMALAASVIFTLDGGTRYRAPLEPVIVVLAATTLVALRGRLQGPERPLAPAGDRTAA